MTYFSCVKALSNRRNPNPLTVSDEDGLFPESLIFDGWYNKLGAGLSRGQGR
jgi:hypothetical protein